MSVNFALEFIAVILALLSWLFPRSANQADALVLGQIPEKPKKKKP